MHLYAPCSVVYSSQDLEITHQPDNKCEAKDGVYVYMESYLIIKKDENLAIYNSFNESWGVMLNEIIRKEKDNTVWFQSWELYRKVKQKPLHADNRRLVNRGARTGESKYQRLFGWWWILTGSVVVGIERNYNLGTSAVL